MEEVNKSCGSETAGFLRALWPPWGFLPWASGWPEHENWGVWVDLGRSQKRNISGPIIIAVLALLVAALYSIRVTYATPYEVWSWWHTFVATIVSIVFALAIGIALFDYQAKRADEVRIKQFRSLISDELSDTIQTLSSGDRMVVHVESSAHEILLAYIQPLVLEEAVKSGLFDSLHTENMLHIARKMHMYNTKTSYFLSVLTAGSSSRHFGSLVAHATQNVEETRQAIVENLRSLLKQMDLPLSPLSEEDKHS